MQIFLQRPISFNSILQKLTITISVLLKSNGEEIQLFSPVNFPTVPHAPKGKPQEEKTHTHNSTERRGKPSGSQKDERSGSSELLVRVNVKKRRQSKKQREQLTPSLDYTWNEMMENKNKGEGGEKE